MKLSSLQVNYSRDHGFIGIDWKEDESDKEETRKVAERMGREEGIEEVTEDENGLGLQFDKADWNIKEIREIYKAAKAA